MDGIFRQDVLDFAEASYGTQAEYPWADLPASAVLRHPNGKWYGVIMNVKKSRLGLCGEQCADILVCKCDPVLRDLLLGDKSGFLPAYHMNKEHWITVVLDGSAEKNLALQVLGESYEAVGRRKTKSAR